MGPKPDKTVDESLRHPIHKIRITFLLSRGRLITQEVVFRQFVNLLLSYIFGHEFLLQFFAEHSKQTFLPD
jgi:hypothetical protein